MGTQPRSRQFMRKLKLVGAILGAFLYDLFINKHHVAPEAGNK